MSERDKTNERSGKTSSVKLDTKNGTATKRPHHGYEQEMLNEITAYTTMGNTGSAGVSCPEGQIQIISLNSKNKTIV
ncbi:MAG: hypothetical protein AABX82_05345, partial [Nanoarchaeota archaeon]